MKNKSRYFLAELLGSCFLVMIIVGSGLMAENLTNDVAVMLIANTIATGAGLFVLITVFADVSGAHFNPFVSIAMAITCLLYTSPSPRDDPLSRMPSSA